MAKWCPVVNAKVVYLECLECEEKICENEIPLANNSLNIPISSIPNNSDKTFTFTKSIQKERN